jgi:hypothetical protein
MGILDDFIKTMKERGEPDWVKQKKAEEQRKRSEEEQKKRSTTTKGPAQTVQEQKAPETISQFGHSFKHMPGDQPHVWFDDQGKAVYIDNVDAYMKGGGKIEVKGVTAAMDPYMYDIYTVQGGPIGQARYYKQDNVIVSLVPDPFAKYRK